MDQELQASMQGETVLVHLSDAEMVSFNVICRLCANPNERIIGIYSEEGISNDLATKMNLYLPVKVSETDTLPLQCCWSCASTVLAWHELVVASVEADRRLRGMEVTSNKADINQEFCGINDGDSSGADDEGYHAFTKSAVDQDPNDTKKIIVAKLEHDTEECYICTICSSKFATETFFIIHQYKRHGIQKPNKDVCFTCEVCKTTFKRRCDMRRHFKMQHVEKKQGSFKRRRRRVDINYEIFCDVCNKGFTRHLDMEKHKNKQHSVDLDCNVSVKIEPKEENDNNELENAKENVKQLLSTDESKTNNEVQICNICEKVFNKKVELNRHLKVEHDQIVRRPRRNKNEIIAHYFCDICSKGFTRKFDMQKHRKSKHPNVPLPQAELTEQQRNIQLLKRCRIPNDDNTNYYQCEVCNRIFRQSYNFMRHQTIHTGIRAYFCHICGKNFRVSGGLHRHITEHHYGVKKYKCDICNQSFAAKATRDDHTNIHTDFRPFICDVCGKAFRQKASLHIHKLFHGDNYRFTCNICGKKYRRASELKIHSWLHTGHKPHQCAICNARFRLRQDLKRHIKIHDKLPESVCKVCGSAFSQERYLKNHMKTHRNEESLPYVVINS